MTGSSSPLVPAAVPQPGPSRGDRLRGLGWLIATIAAIAFAITPVISMLLTSLKSNREITQETSLVPQALTSANYVSLFSGREFGAYLTNSILVTSISVLIALVVGTQAAYVLARFRLRGGVDRYIGFALLMVRLLPPIVIIIPIFLAAQGLGLLNTRLSLIVVYAAFNVTIVVWMMESFFREIPVDLEEAAMVDGDTRFTAFRRIVLPLAAPGLVATGIFAVITTYNEFLFALVLTSTPGAETMPVGAATLIGRINVDWGAMSAAGVIGALPIVVFSIAVQRHLVRGLTMGAVK
ncbi:MAG TPA: carbohydrate ABC transporter permease [Candidatus Limnocylindrales bacterium]|nr:carbohydrate ABC transporter permease [Candidatus Limnocylindrales bacterium]